MCYFEPDTYCFSSLRMRGMRGICSGVDPEIGCHTKLMLVFNDAALKPIELIVSIVDTIK